MELNSLFRWNHLTLLNCYENEIETILIVSIIIFLPPPFSKVFHENRVNTCLAVAKKRGCELLDYKRILFQERKKIWNIRQAKFRKIQFRNNPRWPLTTNRDDSMQLSSEIARSNPWFGRSQRKQACFFSAIDPNYFHATR